MTKQCFYGTIFFKATVIAQKERRRYFYEETKKMFAALLTLCLIFGLSTTAFAATTNGSDVPTPNADFINVCDQIFDGKSWYLVVTATGTYGYQDSTGQIISFPSPTINVSFSDLDALFSGSLDSIRTTTHTVSCPIPGVDYVTGTLGPFTNTSNFTITP